MHSLPAVEEAIHQQERRPVREQRVSLHFSQSNATVPFPPFDGLPGQRIDGPNRAHLALIADLQY